MEILMRYLKKDQIAIIKLNQKEILELVREELFSNYQEFAGISNADIISCACSALEDDGSISVLAAFQPTKGRRDEPNLVCADALKNLDKKHGLTQNPEVFTIEELKEIISPNNS